MNPKVVLAHAGVQYSYPPARALQDAGMLERFFTTIYDTRSAHRTAALRVLPRARRNTVNRYLDRRRLDGLDVGSVREVAWPEVLERALALPLPSTSYARHHLLHRRNGWFDAAVARRLRELTFDVVEGLSGSCLRTLTEARSRGASTIVDQHDIHHQLAARLLAEERELHPEFASTIPFQRPLRSYLDGVDAELALADRIFVPSTFSRDSHVAAGIPPERLVTLLHATEVSDPAPRTSWGTVGRLSVLFVGQVTQRKGIKYLLEAVRELSSEAISLTVVGDAMGSTEPMKRYDDLLTRVPHVNRAELHRLFATHDVLVLPSVYDAFGLVAIDAMAAGMPVVVSANTAAGSDVVRHGTDGYVVPIRDVQAIAEHLVALLDDLDLREAIGRAAADRARQFTVDHYAERLVSEVTAASRLTSSS